MTQPPPPQGKGQTILASEGRKRKCTTEKTNPVLGDASLKTLPYAKGGLKIQETTGVSGPEVQAGANVATSSQPEVSWQPIFRLGDEPLLASASIRTWAQGNEGQIA